MLDRNLSTGHCEPRGRRSKRRRCIHCLTTPWLRLSSSSEKFRLSELPRNGRFRLTQWVEQLMDGLRKAGLEISDKAGASAAVKASDSGTVRADEGFWVAVLPFRYSGSNADLTALAEGLTEEIVTGLSRFSYLKVISRS